VCIFPLLTEIFNDKLFSVMPGGIPHFVLGTGNALCIGRHFYAKSTIRSSVIAIAQTFVLGGSLTNDDNLETRTLLFQLIIFWSNRLDKTDVDGGFFSLIPLSF
jgi:hypothetical protein